MQARETFVTGETVGCINDGKRCYVVVIAVDGDEVTVYDYWNHWKQTYKPRSSDGSHVVPGYEDITDMPNMIFRSEMVLDTPLVKKSRKDEPSPKQFARTWFRKMNPKSV